MRIATAENNAYISHMIPIINPDFLYVQNISQKVEENILASKNYRILRIKENVLFYFGDTFKVVRVKSIENPIHAITIAVLEDEELQFAVVVVEGEVDAKLLLLALNYYQLPIIILGYKYNSDLYDALSHTYVDAAQVSAKKVGHMFCKGFEHSTIKLCAPKNNVECVVVFNDFTC